MTGLLRSPASGPRRRRWVAGLSALALGTALLTLPPLAGTAPWAQAAAADRVTVSADGEVRLVGRGYGHGRGLSQYGAYGAATTGASAQQILDFYYAGTAGEPVAPWGIKVQVTNGSAAVEVLPDDGLAVHDQATGAGGVLPGGPTAWRIVRTTGGYGVHYRDAGGTWQAYTFDGRQVFAGPLQFSGPDIVRLVRSGDVRGYRGALVGVATTSGLATVNNLSMQDYLRGVVPREMPSSWPTAALQAQTIAARTYALAKAERRPAGQYWDICDTTACQVYAGARTWVDGRLTLSEAASTNAAIDATDRLVRTSGGTTILAEFSSSNGGWTADGGTSYTLARQDPWDGIVASSAHAWTASITRDQLQAAFPAVGALRSVEVTARDGRGEWGGRVVSVVLRGVDSSGRATAVTATGNQIRSAGGLRSNWFAFDVPLSAIDARYSGDAGLRSWLGAEVGEERYGAGFAWREYEHGRLYWSAETGVRFLRGDILAAFLAAGGPGALGVPVADEGVAGSWGAYSHFTNDASIYWTVQTGAQVVRGAVRARWLAMGAEWGPLGFPTAGEVGVEGGAVKAAFAGGEIYWSAATGAFDVRGGIGQAWRAGGGLTRFGLPTAGEVAVAGGAVTQEFARGYTWVWSAAGTRLVAGGIREAWLGQGGAAGPLGLPLTDEGDTPAGGGRFSEFAGGTVVWTPSAGAVVLSGAIGARWVAAGGLGSGLGLPTAALRATADGRGQVVPFASGAGIYQATGSGSAFLVRGGVGDRWAAMGGPAGLGLPVTEETVLQRGSGVYQVFAKGKIMWSAATGAHPVYGAIGAAYDALGAEWSRLGLPTRGEYAVPGGVRADFESGSITWNATTGATTVTYR